MKKHKKKHPKLSKALAILLVLGVVVACLYFFRLKPYHFLQTTFSGCRERAEALIAVSGSAHTLNRCEVKTYTTPDGNSLDRIYAVSGDVDPFWEFECGNEVDCGTHTGWFNLSTQIDFIEPPEITSRSPAVNALGCGDTGYRTRDVEPSLQYEDDTFWWLVEYDNYAVKEHGFTCVIDGYYRINGDEYIESKLRLVDATERLTCAEMLQFKTCLSAVAIHEGDIEQCKLLVPKEEDGIESHYSTKCITNYTWYFGDTKSCEEITRDFAQQFDCSGTAIQSFRGSINAANLRLSDQ